MKQKNCNFYEDNKNPPTYSRKWQVKTLNASKERCKCRRNEFMCFMEGRGLGRTNIDPGCIRLGARAGEDGVIMALVIDYSWFLRIDRLIHVVYTGTGHHGSQLLEAEICITDTEKLGSNGKYF
jgi:hypothetical protein